MTEFRHGDWGLFDAIDALMAYDGGATDSGVSDEELRKAVREYLKSLSDDKRRRTLAKYARCLLSDTALADGYGVDDVVRFAEWLEEMGIDF
jgi:hypothetical protein